VNRPMLALRRGIAVLLLLLLPLAACAGSRGADHGGHGSGTTPAVGGDVEIIALTSTDAASERPRMAEPVIIVRDRFEGFNRVMYRFNFEFDQYVFLPIVRGYRFIVPRPVRTGVSNFFSNLGEIRNASNGVLQARPEVASRATIRFLVNSTVGVLGFFDVATRLGVEQQREDFGQTLGWWGVGSGPYLVLPVLGPSSVRDGVGLPVDIAMGALAPPGTQINDVVYATPAPYPLQAVDARYSQPFRYYDSGSAFEYDLVRFLYLQAREAEIRR
jgi:phospholipid-binding lipoprotein MlaA